MHREPAASGSWLGVAFGIGIAAFAAYQQFKLPVVLPVLLERYGYERTLAGGFVSVYAVAGLLLSVWLGRMVHRRGAVAPVLLAMALVCIGSIVTLIDPASGVVVLFGRGLEGVAFAALAVAGPVIASANAPPRQLSIVIGMIAGWIPIGQMSATILAHLSVEQLGWRVLWWVGIGGAVAIGVMTLVLARMPAVTLSGGASAGAARALPLAGRDWRTLSMVGAVFMIWSGQYFAYMTWLPQYLVEVHGVDVRGALLGYLVPVLFVLLFNLLAGAWLRAGIRLGVLLAGALSVQALVWWVLPFLGGNAVAGVIVLAAYGCSAGVVPTCLFATPSSVLGDGGDTASAFGIIMTGRNLGVLVGPVLLAWLVQGALAWTGAQIIFAVLTTIALGIAVVVGMRIPSR